MYAAQPNLLVLVALLKAHGVRHAVVSPGSRNMALAMTLSEDPYFTTYSVVDERSAAYFAIGVALATGESVMLSCTSAQATRNYVPGLTEAYYRNIPVIAVTVDHRPSKLGQNHMQVLDQMVFARDCVRAAVRVPVIRDSDDQSYAERIINETLLASKHNGTGPVHIDIDIDAHWLGTVPELPSARTIARYQAHQRFPSLDGRRVLVVVGQHAPFTLGEQRALDAFASAHDAVVVTNHLSNYHGPHALRASLLLESMDDAAFGRLSPDVAITIGGQVGDYGIDNRLRGARLEHWSVAEDGAIRDTYGKQTAVFQCTDEQFFAAYTEHSTDSGGAYFQLWSSLVAATRVPANLPLSHAHVAASLAPLIPSDAVLHFGILSSLRNWNYFPLPKGVAGYSNVAAFGIDGGLSTFVGHAAVERNLCFMIVGDLSFFYDMNVLGNRHLRNNVRILLVNNDGGAEFALYSHPASRLGDNANSHVIAAGHHGSARGWVESLGWQYLPVHTKGELAELSGKFVAASDVPILMEVFTSKQDDSDGVQMLRDANQQRSLEARIAQALPPRVRRAAGKLRRSVQS